MPTATTAVASSLDTKALSRLFACSHTNRAPQGWLANKREQLVASWRLGHGVFAALQEADGGTALKEYITQLSERDLQRLLLVQALVSNSGRPGFWRERVGTWDIVNGGSQQSKRAALKRLLDELGQAISGEKDVTTDPDYLFSQLVQPACKQLDIDTELSANGLQRGFKSLEYWLGQLQLFKQAQTDTSAVPAVSVAQTASVVKPIEAGLAAPRIPIDAALAAKALEAMRVLEHIQGAGANGVEGAADKAARPTTNNGALSRGQLVLALTLVAIGRDHGSGSRGGRNSARGFLARASRILQLSPALIVKSLDLFRAGCAKDGVASAVFPDANYDSEHRHAFIAALWRAVREQWDEKRWEKIATLDYHEWLTKAREIGLLKSAGNAGEKAVRVRLSPSPPPSSIQNPSPVAPLPPGAGALEIYLAEASQTPLLSIQEEVDLAARIKRGDEEAREHMIKANLRLVVKIAREYEGRGLPLLDLINEGNLGLMKAVERFDPAKGGKFSTYGSWWIKQSIRRALANQGDTIRLPIHRRDSVSQLGRAEQRLTGELNRSPTPEELAEDLDLKVDQVEQLLADRLVMRAASLNSQPDGYGDNDGGSLLDTLADGSAPRPESAAESESARALLAEVIASLPKREREILLLRFGENGDSETLEEVGDQFGVTRERIRQLQNEALGKLRDALARRGVNCADDLRVGKLNDGGF